MPPTRRQKRWSGRLRTAGALLAMLGAVAVADRLVNLASPTGTLDALGDDRAPWIVGAVCLVVGGALYVVGRRWRGTVE